MDGSGFDTWTRRRFGAAAVGLAALAGFGGHDGAGAKKKRKKRKSQGPLCTRDGRVVRQWENPANSLANDVSWHVFGIDGGAGTVASVDEVVNELLPKAAGLPITYVCPIIF